MRRRSPDGGWAFHDEACAVGAKNGTQTGEERNPGKGSDSIRADTPEDPGKGLHGLEEGVPLPNPKEMS